MAKLSLKVDMREAEAATVVLDSFVRRYPTFGHMLKHDMMQLAFADKSFRSTHEEASGVVYADLTDAAIELFVSYGAIDIPPIPGVK